MARNIYGLDPGTYDIKVYDRKKNMIWKEKTVLSMNREHVILAAGNRAYEMYEKTHPGIQVVFPMEHGVIANVSEMQRLLEYLIRSRGQSSGTAEYIFAVPDDITSVERRAFYDLAYNALTKSRFVSFVDHAMADALGAGISIFDTDGAAVVNIGGSTTEISVVAEGGVVVNRLLPIGGRQFDQAVVTHMRRGRDILIGMRTAEYVRNASGIRRGRRDEYIPAAGRSLVTGLPTAAKVPVGFVRAALKTYLAICVREINELIGRTPPGVRRAVEKNGICLTGGGARMKGIVPYLAARTALPVIRAEKPELCAAAGLGIMIQNRREYKSIIHSVEDGNNGWLKQ